MFLSLQEPPGAQQRCVTVDTEAHPQAVCSFNYNFNTESIPSLLLPCSVMVTPSSLILSNPSRRDTIDFRLPSPWPTVSNFSSNTPSIGLKISMWPFCSVCICPSLHSPLPRFPIPPSSLSSHFPLSLSPSLLPFPPLFPSFPLQPQGTTDLGEYDEEIPLENVMQHANLNIVAPVSNLVPRSSQNLEMGSGNETNSSIIFSHHFCELSYHILVVGWCCKT